MLYSVVGTASHINQGHQTPITTVPSAWEIFNLPSKIILGGPLRVSFYPNPNYPGAGAAIDDAVANWNSHLRNNAPTSFTFDVLTRIPNSDPSHDIKVFCPRTRAPAGQHAQQSLSTMERRPSTSTVTAGQRRIQQDELVG